MSHPTKTVPKGRASLCRPLGRLRAGVWLFLFLGPRPSPPFVRFDRQVCTINSRRVRFRPALCGVCVAVSAGRRCNDVSRVVRCRSRLESRVQSFYPRVFRLIAPPPRGFWFCVRGFLVSFRGRVRRAVGVSFSFRGGGSSFVRRVPQRLGALPPLSFVRGFRRFAATYVLSYLWARCRWRVAQVLCEKEAKKKRSKARQRKPTVLFASFFFALARFVATLLRLRPPPFRATPPATVFAFVASLLRSPSGLLRSPHPRRKFSVPPLPPSQSLVKTPNSKTDVEKQRGNNYDKKLP